MKGGKTAFVGINQSMGQYRAPSAGADMYGVLAILPQRCELLFWNNVCPYAGREKCHSKRSCRMRIWGQRVQPSDKQTPLEDHKISFVFTLFVSFPNFNAKLLKTNSPTTYFSVVAMFYRKYADSSSESVVLAAELMPVVTGFCVSHQWLWMWEQFWSLPQ